MLDDKFFWDAYQSFFCSGSTGKSAENDRIFYKIQSEYKKLNEKYYNETQSPDSDFYKIKEENKSLKIELEIKNKNLITQKEHYRKILNKRIKMTKNQAKNEKQKIKIDKLDREKELELGLKFHKNRRMDNMQGTVNYGAFVHNSNKNFDK